jgi:hypothetical protein
MAHPDYHGGSIVNLMRSIAVALGGPDSPPADPHGPLTLLPPEAIGGSRVVLMVIDGLGYDYLLDACPGGALAAGLRGPITSVFPSTTATAITTFMTGLAPQQHALTGWYMWFKEVGAVAAPLPFTTRVGNVHLASMGVDPHRLLGSRPIADVLATRCFIVQRHDLVDTAYTLAHRGEAEVRGYRSLPGFFDTTRDIVRGNPRCFVYAYWPQLDALAHGIGVGARRVRKHLREIDARFGDFVEDLRGTDTTVILTADHGFVDTVPESHIDLADHPRLADTLVVPLCGEQRLAYCYVKPDRREDFETYVAEALGEHCDAIPAEVLLGEGYFGLGQPNPRLSDRIGHYALVMKENYVIRQRLLGERHPHVHVGVHGGTSDAEMHVPLVLA